MMPGGYAAKTDVPVSRSRDEIERILTRFGATGFAYFTQPPRVAIAFEIKRSRIMMHMTLPDREAFALDNRLRRRTESAFEGLGAGLPPVVEHHRGRHQGEARDDR
jgi:hypothetical protein